MYIYTYRTHYLTSALIGKDNFGSKTGVNQVLGIFIYIYMHASGYFLGGSPPKIVSREVVPRKISVDRCGKAWT